MRADSTARGRPKPSRRWRRAADRRPAFRVTSWSNPVSAMRKPRMPCSTARRMSSTAYRSCRMPRSRPANTAPSADAAARPMSHSSRGPHEQGHLDAVVGRYPGHLRQLGLRLQHRAAALRDTVDGDAPRRCLSHHGPQHVWPLTARDLDPEVRFVGEPHPARGRRGLGGQAASAQNAGSRETPGLRFNRHVPTSSTAGRGGCRPSSGSTGQPGALVTSVS